MYKKTIIRVLFPTKIFSKRLVTLVQLLAVP